MAIDPETVRAVHRRDEEWRRRNREAIADNPVLVCARCGWKVDQRTARVNNWTCCQQCGARECRVHALDYIGNQNK